jgi:hypothetical protein
MKRIFVLIAVLTLLVAGTVSVLADPVHIGGGTLTAATLSPIHIGGGTLTALDKMPAHAKAYGFRGMGVEEPEMILLSPVHIGGGT